jgi:type I restriction enzyme R subunit
MQELGEEEARHIREGLDEEALAVFDLLKKPDLDTAEIKRVKAVAAELLRTLKAEKLKIDHWREKEATRDDVRVAIHDFLYSESTGLPLSSYSEAEVGIKSESVFRHVYWAYPTLPSPYYETSV